MAPSRIEEYTAQLWNTVIEDAEPRLVCVEVGSVVSEDRILRQP
jgi:hypothetical protein